MIKIRNLNLGYGGIVPIRNLNIEIEDGDFVCVVGNNGTGKSTLIKAITGLLKPLSGSITLSNLRKSIGYMPQETKVDSHFPASVYEIVLSGTLNNKRIKTFYSKSDKDNVEYYLKLLKIENLKNKCFNELSGGQRQKVLLARSLCATKDLLILDEPTSSLDNDSKEYFYQILLRLNKEKHLTIIMITHDINYIIGNKVLILKENNYFYKDIKEFKKEDLYG